MNYCGSHLGKQRSCASNPGPSTSQASVFYLEKRNWTWMCCFPSIIQSRPPGGKQDMRASCSFSVPMERNLRVPAAAHMSRSCMRRLQKCALQGRGLARCGGVRKHREHAGEQRQQDGPLPLECSESWPLLPGPPVLKPRWDKVKHQQA